MKKNVLLRSWFVCSFILAISFLGINPMATANEAPQATINQPAPGFELMGQDGKNHQLKEFNGHWVVLEWFNPECPFVKKFYQEGHMQKLQETYTKKKVKWLTITSSAAGKPGHIPDAQGAKSLVESKKMNSLFLLDSNGQVGKLYGAKTTPHIFIINPEGKLVYEGAIDDHPNTETKDIAIAKNYVSEVLEAGLKNEKIPVSKTKAYGCSVKY